MLYLYIFFRIRNFRVGKEEISFTVPCDKFLKIGENGLIMCDGSAQYKVRVSKGPLLVFYGVGTSCASRKFTIPIKLGKYHLKTVVFRKRMSGTCAHFVYVYRVADSFYYFDNLDGWVKNLQYTQMDLHSGAVSFAEFDLTDFADLSLVVYGKNTYSKMN